MYWKNFLGITRRNWNPGNVLEKLPENYQQKFRTAEKGEKVFRELPAETYNS